jgi:hypothetical protein
MDTRDYAAEYLAAALESRSTADLTVRGPAWARMEEISEAAYTAGVNIDEITLDEQARVQLHG